MARPDSLWPDKRRHIRQESIIEERLLIVDRNRRGYPSVREGGTARVDRGIEGASPVEVELARRVGL